MATLKGTKRTYKTKKTDEKKFVLYTYISEDNKKWVYELSKKKNQRISTIVDLILSQAKSNWT